MNVELNKDDIISFYTFLNHQKYSHFQVFMTDNNGQHQKIIDRASYPSKSYFINNEDSLIKGCEHFKDKGIICLGINERDKGQTKIEEGIQKINLILFDIDVVDEVRIDGVAPAEYINEAGIVGDKIEKRLNELGFTVDYMAFSGNGLHGGIKVDIDLPKFESKKQWKESDFHKRLVVLENEIRMFETKNVKVDTISKDIARRVKIPGTYNIKRYKIGDKQYQLTSPQNWRKTRITYLNPDINESKNNEGFFNLTLPVEDLDIFSNPSTPKPPREIKYYINKDKKLKQLMEGDHFDYKSRSEAELALLCKLVFYGFNTRSQVDPIMNSCGIGKWSEKTEDYKDMTLEKAIDLHDKNVPSREELYEKFEEMTKSRATWQGYETKAFKKWAEEYLSEDDNQELYIRVKNECLEEFKIITLKQSRLIMVGNGAYYTEDISELEDFIANQIEKANIKNYITVKRNVYELLKDKTIFDEENFYFGDRYVPFLNGYYDLDKNTFHSYEDELKSPFFYVIPHEFKQDKVYDCPKFKKKLNEWIVNPKSKVIPDDMFEAFGYTLTSSTSYKYFFINYGPPHTAKSQCLNILDYLIGINNSTSTSLHRLDDRFEVRFLQWKILAKSADMSKKMLFDNATLKNLTGGDRGSRAEIKGGDVFDILPTAKIWTNVNELPELENLTDLSFFSRVVLFLYEMIYDMDDPENKRDYYLEIIQDPDEVQGIIHESLKGMKRLKERKHVRNEIIENNRHRWLSLSNDPYNFIHEFCEFDINYKVKRDVLWTRYIEEYGDSYGKVKFYQTLYQLGYPAKQDKDPDVKKPFWYIHGLRMKQVNMDEEVTKKTSIYDELDPYEVPDEYK